MFRDGKGLFEAVGGGGEGKIRDVRAGKLYEGAAEEIAQTNTEGGHGKSGDILVGAEGNREKAE